MDEKLQYRVESKGEPLELVVTKDGVEYQVRLLVTAGDVVDAKMVNPFTQIPIFNVLAQVVVDIRPRGGDQ